MALPGILQNGAGSALGLSFHVRLRIGEALRVSLEAIGRTAILAMREYALLGYTSDLCDVAETARDVNRSSRLHFNWGKRYRARKRNTLSWRLLHFSVTQRKARLMTRKSSLISTVLSATLFCSSVTLAQAPVQNTDTPVQDIDKRVHPNLADAQSQVILASDAILQAQKDNNYDMQGHAERARQLLVQVNQELKLAALAAVATNVGHPVATENPVTDASLQVLINKSCNGAKPGTAALAGNTTYSVSSTITVPSKCTVRGNGASIVATASLVGDLISITSVSDVHLTGPLTLNNAQANASSKQSHTVTFMNAAHSSVDNLSFTGSTHGELSLWGVSNFDAQNLTFENASSHPGAGGPAMVVFNWVGGTPTLASTDVNINGVRCAGSPTTTVGCIFLDGNYNHTGTPGQSNQRINISNVTVEAAKDDGIEYDNTTGTISGIHCGPGAIGNQCVLLRQTSHVQVDHVTCDGRIGFCVDVARFLTDDSPVGDIKITNVTGTGVSGNNDSAVVRVLNSNTAKSVTNVTVDGVVADSSSSNGIKCSGPLATGNFLQQISFKNVVSRNNENTGAVVLFCQGVTINNLQTFNNNQGHIPCSSFPSGLYIGASQDVVVNGIRAYDDQGRKTQCYGLTVDGSSKRVSVTNAELRDDLHVAGGVHNASGSAYIVYRKSANATSTIGSPLN